MSPLKTYIVEDSPVIRENLIATLEELGPVQVVGWAADEAGALRWLADPAHDAELVIVDLFLQSGSGLGVLRESARRPRGPHMVVLSNYATADVRLKCLELGAERVFDKSGDIEDLLGYCQVLAAAAPNGAAGPVSAAPAP
jgi:DNA-binding NarL/FixJ family response regulator